MSNSVLAAPASVTQTPTSQVASLRLAVGVTEVNNTLCKRGHGKLQATGQPGGPGDKEC